MAERPVVLPPCKATGVLPLSAITSLIPDHSAFEPDEITAMSTAFELACADLKVFAGDESGRAIIAARIIDLARGGVIDPEALHKRIVAEARVR